MTQHRIPVILFGLLAVALFTVACSSGDSKPAAREAPKRTRVVEEPEPPAEAIDPRRVEAAGMLSDESEPDPPPMVEEEMATPEDHAGHDHADEPPADEGAEKPATMAATTKSTAPPAMKPKSLIR